MEIENKKEIYTALVGFQKDLQSIKKNRSGRFKYADLDAIMEVVRPALISNDLSIIHFMDFVSGVTFLKTQIIHSSGQYIESMAPLSSFSDFKSYDNQEAGKNITYLKRYITMAMLNITIEDDKQDNNGEASIHISERQVKYIVDKSRGKHDAVVELLKKLNIKKVEEIPKNKFNAILAHLENQ